MRIVSRYVLNQRRKTEISLVRTRHLNIRYFFLTDQIEKGNLAVKFCPTNDMIADFMSKPVQGDKFRKFRKEIMNLKN